MFKLNFFEVRKNTGSYNQNRKQLVFLPSLVFYGCLIVGVYIFCSYFNILAWALPELAISSSPKRPEQYLSKSSILDKKISQVKPNSQEQVTKPLNLKISDFRCNLNFSFNPPQNTDLLAQTDLQGFWSVEGCGELKNIQVLQSPQELTNINNRQDILIKNLNSDLKAILYFETKVFEVSLDSFWKELAFPLFENQDKYSKGVSSDLIQIDQKVIYLDGDCQHFSDNSCQLWINKASQKELFFDNFLELKDFLESQYQAKIELFKFAKIQDSYPESINLIAILDSSKIILVRINLLNGLMVQNFLIDSNQDLVSYKKYFR